MIILSPLFITETILFGLFYFVNPIKIANNQNYALFIVALAQFIHFVCSYFIEMEKEVYLITLIINTVALYKYYYLDVTRTTKGQLLYSLSCLFVNLKIYQSMYLYITQCTISWQYPIILLHIIAGLAFVLLFGFLKMLQRNGLEYKIITPMVIVYLILFAQPTIITASIGFGINIILASLISFFFAYENSKSTEMDTDAIYWILYSLLYLPSICMLLVLSVLLQKKNQ